MVFYRYLPGHLFPDMVLFAFGIRKHQEIHPFGEEKEYEAMISQDIRALAPEQDPLRMGMGWKVEDLSKPQIMIESTFGDSHPGSAGLF